MWIDIKKDILRGTNISHPGKRKIIFKSEIWWDNYVSSLKGTQLKRYPSYSLHKKKHSCQSTRKKKTSSGFLCLKSFFLGRKQLEITITITTFVQAQVTHVKLPWPLARDLAPIGTLPRWWKKIGWNESCEKTSWGLEVEIPGSSFRGAW